MNARGAHVNLLVTQCHKRFLRGNLATDTGRRLLVTQCHKDAVV